jgi:predicted enzyme related to lactoylglutathione lyase
MLEIEFILYVSDQSKSTDFYTNLFQISPGLDVPGMTEFKINEFTKLGLMPETGISKIICPRMPNPKEGNGIPRCELYLTVKNSLEYLNRGIEFGGIMVSKLEDRDWGDKVGYLADIDGHIIAFAEKRN